MNNNLAINYLHSIIGALSFSNHLLVWDAAIVTPVQQSVLNQLDCSSTQQLFLEGALDSSMQLTSH